MIVSTASNKHNAEFRQRFWDDDINDGSVEATIISLSKLIQASVSHPDEAAASSAELGPSSLSGWFESLVEKLITGDGLSAGEGSAVLAEMGATCTPPAGPSGDEIQSADVDEINGSTASRYGAPPDHLNSPRPIVDSAFMPGTHPVAPLSIGPEGSSTAQQEHSSMAVAGVMPLFLEDGVEAMLPSHEEPIWDQRAELIHGSPSASNTICSRDVRSRDDKCSTPIGTEPTSTDVPSIDEPPMEMEVDSALSNAQPPGLHCVSNSPVSLTESPLPQPQRQEDLGNGIVSSIDCTTAGKDIDPSLDDTSSLSPAKPLADLDHGFDRSTVVDSHGPAFLDNTEDAIGILTSILTCNVPAAEPPSPATTPAPSPLTDLDSEPEVLLCRNPPHGSIAQHPNSAGNDNGDAPDDRDAPDDGDALDDVDAPDDRDAPDDVSQSSPSGEVTQTSPSQPKSSPRRNPPRGRGAQHPDSDGDDNGDAPDDVLESSPSSKLTQTRPSELGTTQRRNPPRGSGAQHPESDGNDSGAASDDTTELSRSRKRTRSSGAQPTISDKSDKRAALDHTSQPLPSGETTRSSYNKSSKARSKGRRKTRDGASKAKSLKSSEFVQDDAVEDNAVENDAVDGSSGEASVENLPAVHRIPGLDPSRKPLRLLVSFPLLHLDLHYAQACATTRKMCIFNIWRLKRWLERMGSLCRVNSRKYLCQCMSEW